MKNISSCSHLMLHSRKSSRISELTLDANSLPSFLIMSLPRPWDRPRALCTSRCPCHLRKCSPWGCLALSLCSPLRDFMLQLKASGLKRNGQTILDNMLFHLFLSHLSWKFWHRIELLRMPPGMFCCYSSHAFPVFEAVQCRHRWGEWKCLASSLGWKEPAHDGWEQRLNSHKAAWHRCPACSLCQMVFLFGVGER